MVFFNEFTGYEQPESGTFGALCAEKGRKEFCLDAVGHTGTIVRNFKPDGCFSFERRQDADFMLFIDIVVESTCINGVGHQIEQALMDRIRIHADFADGRREVFDDTNTMGACHLHYEFADVIGDIVWETVLVLGFSFFGIGQEIHDKIGCLIDVALDHLPTIN